MLLINHFSSVSSLLDMCPHYYIFTIRHVSTLCILLKTMCIFESLHFTHCLHFLMFLIEAELYPVPPPSHPSSNPSHPRPG